MHCDICGATIALPGQAYRYTRAQFATLIDSFRGRALEELGPLIDRVSRGPYRAEAESPFIHLRIAAHLRATDWHLCPECVKAIGRVLDEDPSLGELVGAVRSGW